MAPKPKLVVLHPVHGYKIAPPQDLKTIKRNARERNRVQTVNAGFERLRTIIPSASLDKKMSKVNILSHAVEYIHCLHGLVQQYSEEGTVAGLYSQQVQSSPIAVPQSPGVSSTSEYGSSTVAAAADQSGGGLYGGYDSGYGSARTPFADYSPRTSFTPSQYSPYTPSYSPATPYSPSTPYSPATPYSSHFTFHNTEGGYSGHYATSTPSLEAASPVVGGASMAAVKRPPDEESSEEEDLLDAIAEWQEQSL